MSNPATPSPTQSASWTSPKRAIGKFAQSDGSRAAFSSVGRQLVKAQGGARQARLSSTAGIDVARRLAGALVAAVQGGTPGITGFLGINLVGRSADEVLAALIDRLAPGGAQNEDAAARAAACTVLEELFNQYALSTAGIEGLAALTMAQVAAVVVDYVATYIFARLMQLLAVRLERGDISTAAACRMERDIRDYIQQRVSQEITPPQLDNVDFTAEDGQRLMEQVFEDAYLIIETWQE